MTYVTNIYQVNSIWLDRISTGCIFISRRAIFFFLSKTMLESSEFVLFRFLSKVVGPKSINKGNNKITELRAILQKESKNS